MKTVEFLRKDLEHVRLIHFVLVIASAAVTYAVLSTWTDAPETARELRALRDMVRTFSGEAIDPQAITFLLADRTSDVPAIKDGLRRLLVEDRKLQLFDRGMSFSLAAEAMLRRPVSVDQLKPNPFTDRAKMVTIREATRSSTWRTRVLSGTPSISVPELTSAQEWISRMANEGWLGLSIDAPIDIGNVAEGIIELVMMKPAAGMGSPLGEGRPLPEPHRVTKTVKVGWKTADVTIAFPLGWFEQTYPAITRNWTSVESEELDRALRWANEQRTAGLKDQKFEILGVRLEGGHAGYIGIVIIGALLVYLICYLETIVRNPALTVTVAATGAVRDFSPWIGAMTHWWARCLTWLTLVMVPCTGTYFALSRLMDLWWPYSALGVLGTAALGLHSTLVAGRIGHKGLVAETVDH